MDEYTGDKLSEMAEKVQKLILEMIAIDEAGADLESLEYYNLAINSLSSSRAYLTVACYKQRQNTKW